MNVLTYKNSLWPIFESLILENFNYVASSISKENCEIRNHFHVNNKGLLFQYVTLQKQPLFFLRTPV